jgi:hypothetical protein
VHAQAKGAAGVRAGVPAVGRTRHFEGEEERCSSAEGAFSDAGTVSSRAKWDAIDETCRTSATKWPSIEAREQAIEAREQAIEAREQAIEAREQAIHIDDYFSSIDCSLISIEFHSVVEKE